MNSVSVDDSLAAALMSAKGLVEIRDANGTLIGFFAPVGLDEARRYAEAAARFDPAEIRRRKEAKGQRYTTAEVMAHLESLEKS